MEDHLLLYLLPTAAIAAVLTSCLLVCCCCYLSSIRQRRSNKKKRSVHPQCIWEDKTTNGRDIEEGHYYPPSSQYTYSIYDVAAELEEIDDNTSIQDVALKASKVNGTLLYTNNGKVS